MLSFPSYADHVGRESRRFLEVLRGADPGAQVPGCPAWNADDLLWHLVEVQHFWTYVIAHRPAPPAGYGEPERPDGHAALVRLFADVTARFAEVLTAADPNDEAWSWSEPDQNVGFTYRRQAHEALIHRVDAEQSVGVASVIDDELAADGVAEVLEKFYGGKPGWGSFVGDGRLVRVDCTDTGDQVWLETGRFTGTDPEAGEIDVPDFAVVGPRDVEPNAVIAGPAVALDLWLWNRGDDSAVSRTGDSDVLDVVLGMVPSALN